jgi:hypothetical protein
VQTLSRFASRLDAVVQGPDGFGVILAIASMLSAFTPPSISSRTGRSMASIRLRACCSLWSAVGMNFWPPNPGLTDMINTRSSFSRV